MLPGLDVSTPVASARAYFHGAHVASWQPAHAPHPVLWMSGRSFFLPDRPIRGGVPICFPWFGPHRSDPSAPAHGFARLADWILSDVQTSSDGTVTLDFMLTNDDVVSPQWPYPFRLTHRIRVGSTLTMTLEVQNVGAESFQFEEALHTYFTVRDVRHVTVAGLHDTDYLDKVASSARRPQHDELITFAGETDRVYLDTAATCVIHDHGLNRRISIAKMRSSSTIVWNPWVRKARAMADFGDEEWPGMLCIESGNVEPSEVRLAAGHTHSMSAEISVALE
jgi:glucose-6-phosphate 1-epimerase